MTSSYRVVEATSQDDYNAAILLWENNLPINNGTGKGKLEWFYKGNPFKKGIIWLLFSNAEKKPVGVGGIGFRPFLWKEKIITGAILADLAIEKKHRTLGPALLLQKTILQDAVKKADFFYAFPNKGAEAVLKRVGYKKNNSYSRFVKIIRSKVFLEKKINKILALIISKPMDLLLGLMVKRQIWLHGNRKYSEGNVDFTDSEIDRLCGMPFDVSRVSSQKDRGILKWRYHDCPYINYYAFGVFNKKQLVGMLVYYKSSDDYAVITDIIVDGMDNNKVLSILFGRFEAYCYKNKVNAISINLSKDMDYQTFIVKRGYFFREENGTIMLYTDSEKNKLPDITDAAQYFWSIGDEDNN